MYNATSYCFQDGHANPVTLYITYEKDGRRSGTCRWGRRKTDRDEMRDRRMLERTRYGTAAAGQRQGRILTSETKSIDKMTMAVCLPQKMNVQAGMPEDGH